MTSYPLGLLAELTHRCPLACPYCSNPLALERRDAELDTATWSRVLAEAGALGVVQLHLSGGEPLVRQDLPEIVAAARAAGLYSNLITSGLGLDAARLETLVRCGLDHVQISLQDSEPGSADRIAGSAGSHVRKLAAARAVVACGLPLTVNVVLHRANLPRMEAMVGLAVELGASRIELAHAQYHGWALRNRGALMIARDAALAAIDTLERLRAAHAGVLSIDAVLPDYHGSRPKACMGGWGRRVLNVSPSGRVLPCHGAEGIPGLRSWSVTDHGLAEIWERSPAFDLFRGDEWMQEPCRSCPEKARDFGGCRCQALALLGDAAATDPACALSPHHAALARLADAEAHATQAYAYRGRPSRDAAHETTAPTLGRVHA